MAGLELEKSLLVMEDIACGAGKATQRRQGVDYVVGKVDIAYAVSTEQEVAKLDINKFTYAKLGEQEYRYSDTFSTGDIKSDFTTKYWRKVNKPLPQYPSTGLPDAAQFQGVLIGLDDGQGKASPVVYSDGVKWLYMDNTEV